MSFLRDFAVESSPNFAIKTKGTVEFRFSRFVTSSVNCESNSKNAMSESNSRPITSNAVKTEDKNINKDIICMVDNCYGEFICEDEPSDVGADMCVGSLIKNPGGGLAPMGGYIAGTKKCVENASYRLTTPSLGKEVGASLNINQSLYQGLFMAPQVTSSALKAAIFAAIK